MTHGSRTKNTLFSVMRPAVLGFLGEEDDGGVERRYRFSEEGSLEAVFKAAGFTDIEEREAAKPLSRKRATGFGRPCYCAALGPG